MRGAYWFIYPGLPCWLPYSERSVQEMYSEVTPYTFVDLYYVLDNVMKERTRRGLGKVKHCSPISNELENKMWNDGILGEDNPERLVETVVSVIEGSKSSVWL